MTTHNDDDSLEFLGTMEQMIDFKTTPLRKQLQISIGDPTTTVPPQVLSPGSHNRRFCFNGKSVNSPSASPAVRRSSIIEVKIRSDDDEIIEYQEIRITGIIYCNHENQYEPNEFGAIDDEETFLQQKQQSDIMHDSPYGFLRSAGVVYACGKNDDDDALSLNSNDATRDPFDRDYFFDDMTEQEDILFESPKGVMQLESALLKGAALLKGSSSYSKARSTLQLSTGNTSDHTTRFRLPILPRLTFSDHR